MERLTKRSNKTVHENGVCCTHYLSKECEERSGYCTDECPWEEAVWSKLADYEDAEEQGLLLRLPFLPKPGMKIYDIYGVIENGEAEPREITVRSFNITHARMWYFHINNEVFTFDDFGKTYFLTREEAESALAEKGGAE